MFKVGDRVIYNSPEEYLVNEAGTVIHIYPAFPRRVLVEFDNPGLRLHDGGGAAEGLRKKNNSCWNCYVPQLSPIAPLTLENI